MKYLYIGSGILIMLLALCILVGCVLSSRTEAAAEVLQQALDASLTDDFQTAANRAKEAADQWHGSLRLYSSFLCHDETDEVTIEFAELMLCSGQQGQEEFQLHCASLLARLHHIAQMDLPLYHNILMKRA